MNRKDLGLTIIVALAALAILLGFQREETVNHISGEEFSYEMMRPKAQTPDFSLAGRQVDYNAVNPFLKKAEKPEAKGQDKAKAERGPQKAEDKKTTAKNLAKSQKKSNTKAPEVSVNVVGGQTTNDSFATSPSGTEFNAPAAASPTAIPGYAGGNIDSTIEEWVQRLAANPNTDNISQLVKLYHTKQLTTQHFYEILKRLSKSNRTDLQHVVIYALGVTPSKDSFIMLSNLYPQVGAREQAYAMKFLKAYSDLNQLSYLEAVLKEQDELAIYMAMELIVESAQKAKLAAYSKKNEREFRGQSYANELKQFAGIYDTLIDISTDQKGPMADAAQEMLGTLQQIFNS